ncbi:MAG: hypothetical protein AB1428_02340 [Bacteroidota bacterium]
MTFLTLIAALSVLTEGDTGRENGLYREAMAALQRGDHVRAGEKARQLVAADHENAGYYMILGDASKADGNLRDAAIAYERSSALRGHHDPEALRRLAEVQEWMRRYTAVRQTLTYALRQQPDDEEVKAWLESIGRRRSIHFFGSSGGWEADYARNVHELGAFVGWLDRADLYGGWSQTDRVFYRRTNLWSDAYLFLDYRTYLRVGLRDKKYEYPAAINPSPDHSSYARSYHVQVEVGYTYGKDNSVSLELEYFRPKFFWNNTLRADNMKATLNLRNTISGPFYGRLFAAILRDPDPANLQIDPMSGSLQSFAYEKVWLIGAGAGYDDGRFAAEVKYVPDRDLDRSLSWSIFCTARYMMGRYGVRGDLLFDKYRVVPGRTFGSSNVAMLTLLAEPWDMLELRAGVRVLSKPISETAPFLHFRLKTGL